MNWEIVVSVIVALGLFIGAMATVCMSIMAFMYVRAKRSKRAGGSSGFPMRSCPFHKKMRTAGESASDAR